jgi:hypothetical protein
MKSVRIDPPQVSAAFYFDRPDATETLLKVCNHLGSVRRLKPVSIGFVQSARFPTFALVSDLAGQIVTAPIAPDQVLDQDNSQELQILRVNFDAADVGAVVVAFDGISDDLVGSVAHPVSVTISGALMTMPQQSLRPSERRSAVAAARFVLEAFRTVCEQLGPLYGAIQVEAFLSTPPTLISHAARLGTEVFVSNRLLHADTQLETRLSAAFVEGFAERWDSGIFCSGWTWFNPRHRTVKRPLAVGTEAASALGAALRSYQPPGSPTRM